MNTEELKNWTKETGLYKTGHGYSHWVEILSNIARAPEDGLYLFVCIDDNHFEYVLSHCSSGDNLHNCMMEANQDHEPDFLLAFHPIPMYSMETNSWIGYTSGDTAKINGIYIWLIKKDGKVKYVYRSYKKGEDMLPKDMGFYHNGIYEEFQDSEFIAYHGCFNYTVNQLDHHHELYKKFNQ